MALWSGRWDVIVPETKPVQGSRRHPSVRYSAAGVFHEGHMIISHGYFYDHQHREPAWQSSAWSFNVQKKRWRMVHEGESAGAPSARYSTSAVLYDHAMYMFGGDDGGHKTSMHNYIFKSWFDELWRLDLRSFVWERMSAPGGISPPKRALHSAVVVGNAMYIYGGLGRGDTWRYDFHSSRWTLLVPESVDDSRGGVGRPGVAHPGKRHAHAAAAGSDGFYIFGGSRHRDGMKRRILVLDDLWHYSTSSSRWEISTPVDGVSPPARAYHSMLTLASPAPTHTQLVVYGGAHCAPGCKCYGDVWVWDTRQSRWAEMRNVTARPIWRYRQNFLQDPRTGYFYLYGGESYKPYMYHNAVDRLTLSAPGSHPAVLTSATGAPKMSRWIG